MAKGGSKAKGGRRAPLTLRDLYGHRLDAIRAENAAEARARAQRVLEAGGDLVEAARFEALAKRRENASDFALLTRQYKADVAKAYKAGLLASKGPKATELSRKGRGGFGQKILGVIEEAGQFLQGRQKAVRLTKRQAEALAKQYANSEAPPQIIRGRILMDENFRVTKEGAIQQIIPGFTQQKRIYFDEGREDIEETITKLFASMSDRQVVIIMIGENHSLYFDRDMEEEFRETLFAYGANGALYVTLGVFKDRHEADRELNYRADIQRANQRERIKVARRARKAKERKRATAERQARTGPLGEYLHSGKFGPSAADIAKAKAAGAAERKAARAAANKVLLEAERKGRRAAGQRKRRR